MKYILQLVLISVSLPVAGQLNFTRNDSISVRKGSAALTMPWAGGLNYPQFSEIDYDFDGDQDLLVFDRSRNNIRLFENTGGTGISSWKPVPDAAKLFPSDVEYRVALVDYDGDEKADLFTHSNGGVRVYRNIGDAINGLQWQLVSPLLYTFNKIVGATNLFVSSNDVPAYTDVDADGDVDILTFSMAGDRVEYHKNLSIETFGHRDSLVFELRNQCWGMIREDGASPAIFLNDVSASCGSTVIGDPEMPLEYIQHLGGKQDSIPPTRHTGSTLLALDIDHSGVMDLIVGDVSSENLTLLINGGTAPNTNSAMVSQDVSFPSYDIPVQLSYFPASYQVDADRDGLRDLVIAPNARNSSENRNGILLYKNTNTNLLPKYTFQTNGFLQQEMIDNGTGGVPVFVDENGDGAEDLLVSGFFRYKYPLLKESVFQLYRNNMSAVPSGLSWISDDYFSLSAQNFGLRTIPAFGDLDSDQDQDMILGMEDGTLIKLENTAGSGQQLTFGNLEAPYTDADGQAINVGAYAFPQLIDLDEDGLVDLVIGNKNGEIVYYHNDGTANAPAFRKVTDTLGGIDLSPNNNSGYAAPHFFKYQDTLRLLLGGFDGYLHYYDDIRDNLDAGAVFHLIDTAYNDIFVEAYSACWVTDLDQDGKPDLYVGGDLGGINRFEHDPDAPVAAVAEKALNPIFRLYPNPTEGMVNVYGLPENTALQYQIIDLTGKLVSYGDLTSEQIPVSELRSGMYFLQLHDKANGWITRQPFVKQ